MFKQFNSEQVNTYEFRSHKTYTLNQSNVNRKQFLSESLDDTATNYYNFARINFYMSGSDLASEGDKFNTYLTIVVLYYLFHNLNLVMVLKKVHLV